jgi:hypothetical protein
LGKGTLGNIVHVIIHVVVIVVVFVVSVISIERRRKFASTTFAMELSKRCISVGFIVVIIGIIVVIIVATIRGRVHKLIRLVR